MAFFALRRCQAAGGVDGAAAREGRTHASTRSVASRTATQAASAASSSAAHGASSAGT